MRALLAALLLGLAFSAQAQPRNPSQPELEALLAPIALYPDDLVAHVLAAAAYPDDVHEAAEWLRENPQLSGEEAERAAEPILWHPSLKELLRYPELLERMHESPQWTEDLGAAYLSQQAQVWAAVQTLRQRAQAQPYAPSVAPSVLVQPVVESQVVYLPYYNPLVVYGTWRHAHRPIFWRPWSHRRHDSYRPPAHVKAPLRHAERRRHFTPEATIHNHYYQARRARPIVQGAPLQRPHRR